MLTPITLANHISAAAIEYANTGKRPRAQMAGGFSVGAAAAQVADDLDAVGAVLRGRGRLLVVGHGRSSTPPG